MSSIFGLQSSTHSVSWLQKGNLDFFFYLLMSNSENRREGEYLINVSHILPFSRLKIFPLLLAADTLPCNGFSTSKSGGLWHLSPGKQENFRVAFLTKKRHLSCHLNPLSRITIEMFLSMVKRIKMSFVRVDIIGWHNDTVGKNGKKGCPRWESNPGPLAHLT